MHQTVHSRRVRIRRAIARGCLVTAISLNVAASSQPLAPVPPVAATSTNAAVATNATGALYSQTDERKAWIIALRKFSESDQKKRFDWQPLLTAVVTTLTGAAVAIFTLWFSARREAARERLRMEHEATLKNQDAKRQVELALVEGRITYADKLLDLRLKQLELFFAPLHALLQQSKGVYAKLTMQLLEDKSRYRQADDPEMPDGRKLEVFWADGRWYDWRLLDQMPPLKRDRLYRPLIDEIMRIGKEMTTLIQKHGAFAVDEKGVSDVFGEYLAHYAILLSVHRDGRAEAYVPGQHKIGYYPRRLNGIVEARYKALLQDLQPYISASNAVLAQLKKHGDIYVSTDTK